MLDDLVNVTLTNLTLTVQTMHRMPNWSVKMKAWINEQYRLIMLVAMGIELLLLAILVILEALK